MRKLPLLLAISFIFMVSPSWSQTDSADKSEHIRLLGKIERHTDAAEFAKPFVYMSDRGKFCIYDVSEPSKPLLCGTLDLKTTASQMQLVGQTALVATVSGSLQAVAIHNPQKPELLSSTVLPGKPFFMTIRKELAFLGYINDKNFGFVIIDIYSPNPLKVIGRFESPKPPVGKDEIMENTIINVTPSGKTVLMNVWDYYRRAADSKDVLMVIDTTNPIKPMLAKKFQAPAPIVNIIIADYYAQVDYYHTHVNFTDAPSITGSLYFNLSDATNPKIIKSENVPPTGRGKGGYHFGVDTLAIDKILYSLDGFSNNGLLISDISDPNHPKQIGYYPLQNFRGARESLWVSGDLILVNELSRKSHGGDWLDLLEFHPGAK